MDIGKKIESLLQEFDESQCRVREHFLASWDNFNKVNTYIPPAEGTRQYLLSYLSQYRQFGELVGTDSKGHTIRMIHFELIKEGTDHVSR